MIPRFRRGAFILFCLSFVASMLLADLPAGRQLLLAPGGVLAGEGLWQPLSALFAYPDALIGGLAATLVVQWGLGSRLEEFWGTRRYLVMALSSGVAGYAALVGVAALVPDAARSALGGPGPLDVAASIAFAIAYGRQRFTVVGETPILGRSLGLAAAAAVLGVHIVAMARGPLPFLESWPTLIPLLVSAAVALVFVRQRGGGDRVRSKSEPRRSKAKDRGHLRVVRGADDLLN